MPSDESPAATGYVREPKSRADCADFFCAPDQTNWIGLRGPIEVTHALEQAAEEAGRTWNDQLIYVFSVCRGEQLPSLEDKRTAEDWRTLMGGMQMCLNEGEEWIPCSVIFNRASSL